MTKPTQGISIKPIRFKGGGFNGRWPESVCKGGTWDERWPGRKYPHLPGGTVGEKSI